MYFENARVYQVHNDYVLFQIGDCDGDPIIAKVQIGLTSDKLIQAHKLAEMPVDFFIQYEEMAQTILVCSKCGCTEEYSAALKSGWLHAQRKNAPAGHLVIRCPQHITGHALKLAGLPKQTTSKRIVDNLDLGLWSEYGDDNIASVWQDIGAAALTVDDLDDDAFGAYIIQYHKEGFPPFNTARFHTIEALIVAMRQVEPDLRKWRLREA